MLHCTDGHRSTFSCSWGTEAEEPRNLNERTFMDNFSGLDRIEVEAALTGTGGEAPLWI